MRFGSIRFGSINGAVICFLLLTSVVALYVIVSPGSGDNWIINPLSGITAIAFCLLAFARLSVGAPSKITKRIWQGIIAVFCTVAASQFLEGYRESLSQNYGIDDIADCVLLVVSPVTMWMVGKFDPPPLFTRGLFLLGFLLQSVATILDVVNAVYFAHWGWDTTFIDLITDLGQFISLQIYLVAVAIFLVSLHLHQRISSRGVHTVGQLSRYLFVRLRLFDKLRYPELPFRLPGVALGVRLGLWCFHFVTWVPLIGQQIRRHHGKSLSRQVMEVFQLGLTAGLDARAYYMFGMYGKDGLASSARYLTLFETRNGLFPAIGDFIAHPLERVRSPIQDRRAFSTFCAAHDIPCIAPLVLDEYARLDQGVTSVPRQSCDVVLVPLCQVGGKRSELFQHIGNGRYLDRDGMTFSSGEVFGKQLSTTTAQQHAVFLPRLVNHPALSGLRADVYAGLQVVTCMTPGKQPIVTHALLQLHVSDCSWDARPDMVAPIQLSDGQIGRAMPVETRAGGTRAGGAHAGGTLAGHESRQRSQVRVGLIEDLALPSWPEIQRLVLTAHGACCDRFILAWEITYTPAGPALAGVSEFPDVELLQQAHHEPISTSPLGLPLYQYLCLLEAGA